MKWHLLVLLLVVALTGRAATNVPPSLPAQEQLFMEAVLLAGKGFYSEAETRLKQLVAANPNQPMFREMLAEVQAKTKGREEDPQRRLRRKLASIVFPEIRFREARATDVIAYIEKEAEQLSTDKTPINFIWMVPEDTRVGPVTLSLKQVPLLDVLNYVTQIAGLKYRVDSHAVVIYKSEMPPAPKTDVRPE